MFIGNIVTNTNLGYKNFNIINSFDDIIINLPTLIIGWDNVKTIAPNADYFDRKLSDDIFWTFSLTEKRDMHEEDLYYFIKKCYEIFVSKSNYIYIDFLLFENKKILNIFDNIKLSSKKIGFQTENMIYINVDNLIYGIDLNVIDYIGKDRNQLINYLKNNISVLFINNEILIEYKDYMVKLNNNLKYIPYIYSVEHE
jgi:hypothetical protein